MRKYAFWVTIFLLILGWTSLPGKSQEANQASGKDVTVTVTVQRRGPNAPTVLNAEDVFVYQNNQRRPVVQWVPATGRNGGLDLVILIDDSVDTSIGTHYVELKDFIRSLPASTKVAIAYASHGSAVMTQNFTTGHERAAAAIRLPRGPYAVASGTYMALTDLIKHWPEDGNRRAVLVLSDGVDLYWGMSEALPSNNPNLHEAVAAAQRGGVNVYTIYANSTSYALQNSYLATAGQSCLEDLAQSTGGKAYFQGLQTPIDFQPILQNVKSRLESQHLLTFRAEQGKKDSYDRLRITTEQPQVKLVAPKRVYVPGIAM